MERILFGSYQTFFRGGVIFFLLLLFACSSKNNRQNATTEQDTDTLDIYLASKQRAFDTYFSDLFHRHMFNGNVLIAQKGDVLFQKSYGVSNFRSKKPLKLDGVFQLGSVSKQFTAVAILQLYEQNKLQLNDSIQKFFPDFPYKNISVHDLLCHRSGLMNYIYYCDEIWQDKSVPLQNDSVIQILTDSFPTPYYPPNKRFDYSNTGYMLLASIVEQVSDTPFREYVKKNIFEPLGMKNSYVYNHKYPFKSPNLVTGYEYGFIEANPDFLDGAVGDKGVYSTVHDLWLWDKGLYDNKIIKKETLDLAFQPHGKKKSAKVNYGYGWRLYYAEDSTKVIYHAGWWHGYNALIMRLEHDTSTVVVLKNKSNQSNIDQAYLLEVLKLDKEKP